MRTIGSAYCLACGEARKNGRRGETRQWMHIHSCCDRSYTEGHARVLRNKASGWKMILTRCRLYTPQHGRMSGQNYPVCFLPKDPVGLTISSTLDFRSIIFDSSLLTEPNMYGAKSIRGPTLQVNQSTATHLESGVSIHTPLMGIVAGITGLGPGLIRSAWTVALAIDITSQGCSLRAERKPSIRSILTC